MALGLADRRARDQTGDGGARAWGAACAPFTLQAARWSGCRTRSSSGGATAGLRLSYRRLKRNECACSAPYPTPGTSGAAPAQRVAAAAAGGLGGGRRSHLVGISAMATDENGGCGAWGGARRAPTHLGRWGVQESGGKTVWGTHPTPPQAGQRRRRRQERRPTPSAKSWTTARPSSAPACWPLRGGLRWPHNLLPASPTRTWCCGTCATHTSCAPCATRSSTTCRRARGVGDCGGGGASGGGGGEG